MLYTLVIRLYTLGIWITSFFSEKAKLWIEGRKDLLNRMRKEIPKGEQLIWIHCASLGEFEQGRPLIESLKKETDYKILLTFFSPSGYEIRKNYTHADYIYYLPADSPSNAKAFLEIVQPQMAVFVKYEFWYNYLSALQKNKIPTILVSALFRKDQLFFRWYGKRFLQILKGFDYFFLQNQSSATFLEKHDIEQFSVVGDTRIDRVLEIAAQAKEFPLIADFTKAARTMVCGSTWDKDEAIICNFINKNKEADWKFIFAPHEIDEAHITRLQNRLEVPTQRYSVLKKIPNQTTPAKVLIIDNIGMLSALYKYGKVAYIGGGFGTGIHNVLEPIAFGLPVIFGPKYQKFTEAVSLIEQGGGFSIENEATFTAIFNNLEEASHYEEVSAKATDYILQNKGATTHIIEWLKKELTLELSS